MELYEYEREHRDLLRRLAPECMVLLKSDGTFPLEAPCKVALYGSGARETHQGRHRLRRRECAPLHHRGGRPGERRVHRHPPSPGWRATAPCASRPMWAL